MHAPGQARRRKAVLGTNVLPHFLFKITALLNIVIPFFTSKSEVEI